MIDEDLDACSHAFAEHFSYVDPRIAVAKAEADALNLPFDLHNVIDENPFVYGRRGDGPLIGKTVKFLGGTIRNILGDEDEIGACVGVVVAHDYGRIVIGLETQDGYSYLGWINPQDFEIVFLHTGNTSWRH